MRLTFIKDEQNGHSVSVNNEGYQIQVPESVPAKVYAVQVYTTYTEVENFDLTNETFADPPSYVQNLVQAWQQAKEKAIEEAEQQAQEAQQEFLEAKQANEAVED
jgi:hypothetical protein